MNVLSGFFEAELLVREGGDGRHLIGIMVPWNTATPVDSSGRWQIDNGLAWESFARGALDRTLTEQGEGLPLFGGFHPKDSTATKAAGVLVRSENLDHGQVGEWRAFNNYEGNELLEMASTKVWRGFSVSYAPVRTAESTLAGRKHFIRQEVKLDHVAFLRKPGYADAELLAMRSELEDRDPAAVIAARIRLRKLRREALAWAS